MLDNLVSAGRWLGTTAAIFVVCAAAADAQSVAQFDFDLPAQPLEESLRAVALRTGASVIAPSDAVAGKLAPPLRGRFSPAEAIARLIVGRGLVIEKVGESFVVRRTAGAGRAAGEISLPDEEAIVVTGTNLRGVDPASPLIRISRDEIDRSGATSVEQLMRRVPQNMRGGVNQENAGVTLPDQDVTDHGAGLNLRGLGQRATLVLVNGRRLAPSGGGAFVDVSMIPVTALERVEILPDGASAIYGSDAVGGVVNFILKEGVEGLETGIVVGAATRGGGTQLQLSQSAGTRWKGGGGMVAYEFRREDEIRAGQRDLTVNLRPGTFLLPRERRHSILATLEHDLADGLSAGLTATYARRNTERTVFQAVSALPVGVTADADAVSLAGQLAVDVGSGWQARLGGNFALSDTSQRQSQPGGLELVNARDVRNSILEASLRVDGPVTELPGGSVRLAIGGATRREDYRDGFRSAAIPEVVRRADRNVRSAFGELLVPIVSRLNRRTGIERLELSAAARYDHYSGTGSSFDPKLGLVWSPAAGLDLRASYSTSFRAPLLSEISGAYNAIYLPARFLYADPAQAPAGSIGLFLQGSNPAVTPERSRTWSFGADLAPRFAPGLKVSLNYYDIRFSDRIALPTSRVNLVGNPAFEPIVDRAPGIGTLTDLVGGAQLILDATGPGFSNGGATPADVDIVLDGRISNTAVTRTRGFDLALRYAVEAGRNAFVLDAAVTHILAFDDRLTVASPVVDALDRPYRPLDWRGRAGIAWSRDGWAGSLFLHHADSYLDDRAPLLRRVGAYTTLDASLAYGFGGGAPAWLRGTRVAVFAENLLDAPPPRLVPDPGATSGLGYDPVNATGRGRFLAVQLRRTW
jgi:outer membrane receptor protein involved in Fe transport